MSWNVSSGIPPTTRRYVLDPTDRVATKDACYDVPVVPGAVAGMDYAYLVVAAS